MSTSRLFRSESDQMIAGVCSGVAAYLDIDPVMVRLGFVILGLASGIGVPLYIALWVIAPTESSLAATEDMIHFGDDPQDLKASAEHSGRNSAFIAGLMILVGAYFLFGNFGINILPFVLIGLGVWLVVRNR